MRAFGSFLARLFISGIFLLAGIRKIIYFADVKLGMAAHGIPLVDVVTVITIILEVGGALCLILGWNARPVALLLFLFLIPVTFVYHTNLVQPGQLIDFFKNLAIMGGLLNIAIYGAGPWSLDERFL